MIIALKDNVAHSCWRPRNADRTNCKVRILEVEVLDMELSFFI